MRMISTESEMLCFNYMSEALFSHLSVIEAKMGAKKQSIVYLPCEIKPV